MANGAKPKPKTGAAKTAKRREELRRVLPKPTLDVRSFIQQPEFINTAVVTFGFLVLISVLTIWSREQLKVEVGQVMTDTRLKRLDYSVPNQEKTDSERNKARESAPQIYKLNSSYLDLLAGSLNGLPKAVAGKESIEEIADHLREEFRLTASGLQACSLSRST